MKPTRACALLLLGMLIAACNKEATGQVAAIVNGEEITLQEINAELGAGGVPEGSNKEAVQRAALQRIIERRLLAQQASEDGVDKSPEYLLRERQMRDALAVRLMGERAERSLRVPDQQEIDRFIADNPVLFGNRKIFTIDRIQFPMPGEFDQLRALESDHSMQEVAATLERLGIEFQRDSGQLDSALLGTERLERIQSLPAGEPFVFPENGQITVAVITGSRDAPMSTEQARPLAMQALRNQQLTQMLQQRLSQARNEAKIEYQEGFAPTKNAPSMQAARADRATNTN